MISYLYNFCQTLSGNSSVYGIGKLLWWKISMHMMKYQHTCAGTPSYVYLKIRESKKLEREKVRAQPLCHPKQPTHEPFRFTGHINASGPKRKNYNRNENLSFFCEKWDSCATYFDQRWGPLWTSPPWRCAPFLSWQPSPCCKSGESCLNKQCATHATPRWQHWKPTTTTTTLAARLATQKVQFLATVFSLIRTQNCVSL